jgi:hypothetical protein
MSKLFPIAMILTVGALAAVLVFQIMDLRAFGVL